MGKMWFGTTDWMQWIDTPTSGADMSPDGHAETGTLASGGAYAFVPFGSHKTYSFSWSGASALRQAQLMKSYADGAFGRGLIYFIDPLIAPLNILPARWANPGMTVGDEGGSLVYGEAPQASANSSWQDGGFPMTGATYSLDSTPAGWRGREEALFLPIPAGHTLHLGAAYSSTGAGGVFIREHTAAGEPAATSARLTELPLGETLVNTTVADAPGVWLYVGKNGNTAGSTVTLRAMTARLVPNDATPAEESRILDAPWIGGMGHSGCRFAAKPTYVANSGVGGGQAGYAASFIEVGSWLT